MVDIYIYQISCLNGIHTEDTRHSELKYTQRNAEILLKLVICEATRLRMEYILALVVLTMCMVPETLSRSIDYDDFLMQTDPHGWFGNFIDTDRSRAVPRGCGGKPADIYFVMDTSRDVTQTEIDLQKKYLKELSALFYLDRNTVRLGVVSSGSTPLVAVRLGAYRNTDGFKEAIDVTPKVGGQRDLAQTLDFLRRKGFAPSVARQSVAHVVIFMTNGFSHNAKLTMAESQLLKKQGVYVYAVNLGGRVDKSELTAIASSPASEFVFNSDDYNIVNPMIKLLKIHECTYQTHPPEPEPKAACTPRRPVDMIFGVDYLHLGTVNTRRILSLIDGLMSDFDHGDNFNTGLLLSRHASLKGPNTKLTRVQETEEEVKKITFPDFSSLLRRTRKTLSRGRESVQKTAVLFVDSSVPLTMSAFKEAKRNKAKKIETYVIYIGDDYNKDDLALISNGVNGDNIIIIPSYHELDIARDDILAALCKGL